MVDVCHVLAPMVVRLIALLDVLKIVSVMLIMEVLLLVEILLIAVEF